MKRVRVRQQSMTHPRFFYAKILLVQVWIGNPGVVDGFQSFDEYRLGQGYVAEGDRTLPEETACYLTINELIGQCADTLFGIFFERT